MACMTPPPALRTGPPTPQLRRQPQHSGGLGVPSAVATAYTPHLQASPHPTTPRAYIPSADSCWILKLGAWLPAPPGGCSYT
jgi:hypothetical protein